ncbi:MAG: hypothetical protein PHP92_05440 [Candidatus Nanoarchaeia archaeon]|jgi:hypothetical protein|nr:hypothetical protein [Candidatus Nanoarchaeia archaeon]
MAILDDVKISLRISTTITAYNTEINDLISACKADLALSGIYNTSDTDTLVKRAIMTYVKANFGYNNPDSDRLRNAYESLKNHLTLSQDYAFYAVTFSVKNSSAAAIDEAKIVFNGETKYTGSAGTAIFYVRAANNYEYQITHEDYQDYVDSDNEWYNVDVSASTTINIIMSAL